MLSPDVYSWPAIQDCPCGSRNRRRQLSLCSNCDAADSIFGAMQDDAHGRNLRNIVVSLTWGVLRCNRHSVSWPHLFSRSPCSKNKANKSSRCLHSLGPNEALVPLGDASSDYRRTVPYTVYYRNRVTRCHSLHAREACFAFTIFLANTARRFQPMR
jgi:hypothetical protein